MRLLLFKEKKKQLLGLVPFVTEERVQGLQILLIKPAVIFALRS